MREGQCPLAAAARGQRSVENTLRARRWELPTYAALAGVVTEAFRTVEQQLTTHLTALLTPAVRQHLDALFTTDAEEPAHPHRPYRLTALKRSLELMRPSAIRANVQDYALLQPLFSASKTRPRPQPSGPEAWHLRK